MNTTHATLIIAAIIVLAVCTFGAVHARRAELQRQCMHADCDVGRPRMLGDDCFCEVVLFGD